MGNPRLSTPKKCQITWRLIRSSLSLLLPALGWAQVSLSPGNDLQSAVDQNPAGTTFTLSSGIYRLQSIHPKDGDKFLGKPGAVLNGSMVLSSWTAAGNVWTDASGFTTPGQVTGYCDSSHPMCVYPEDLFFDSVLKSRVAPGNVSAACGCWSLDYGSGLVTVGDNPSGHLVEMSVTRSAFWGSAANVQISGFIIEKYATPGQFGAIGDQYPGTSWVISNNEVRLNHGAGVNVTSGSSVTNNYIHHNGEKGYGAGGNNVLIQGNEISFNNTLGFDCNWECGGGKAAQVNNLTVKNNYVHENYGPGLWTDVDGINVVYDGNIILRNRNEGLTHEVSYAATISNNTLCYNGSQGVWLWQSQILISSSQNVAIYGNHINVGTAANSIGLIQQNRGVGAYGPHVTANNSIHDNHITAEVSPYGTSGIVGDYNQSVELAANNLFDTNHYHVPNAAGPYYWLFGSGNFLTFSEWQANGQDVRGSVDAAVSACAPPSFSWTTTSGSLSPPPPVALAALSCSPASLNAGASAVCTLTLNQAASNDVAVALSTNNPALTVPASVTIVAGSTGATFSATAGAIASNQTAIITAAYSSSSQQANIVLAAPGVAKTTVVSSLSCAQTGLGVATCTVMLSQAAPADGLAVTLSTANTALTLPASVTVAAGATTGTFTVQIGSGNNSQMIYVTATYNGSSQQTGFSLLAQPSVTGLLCSPVNLVSGASTTCIVTLFAAAPASGATVTLSSDNASLTVPASITIPAGATNATFTATAGDFTRSQTAYLTAAYNGNTQGAALSLVGPGALNSITCAVASLNGGASTNCSVILSAPAVAGGAVIALASDQSALSVPASVTIAAGNTSASFTVSAGTVTSRQTAVITAVLNGVTQTVSLTLLQAQTLLTQSTNNAVLKGDYFVRQISVGVDRAGKLMDPRSVIGTITFDGNGNYSFTGQLTTQDGLGTSQTATGSYSVDAAGMVLLDSLVRLRDKVNARFGPEAIVGSATESGGNVFDLLIAIPAPTAPINNTSLKGQYWTATLEFPGGDSTNARNALFLLNSLGDGTFQPIRNTGRAANRASGQLVTEQIPGATYTMATDGSGAVNFGSASSVLAGTKTIYISRDGNVLMGGSPNSHDILIGIRAPAGGVSNSDWSGAFWSAGFRQDSSGVKSFAGSAVASGSGSLYWTRRFKVSGAGNLDVTEVDPYSLSTDGSGTSNRSQVTVGVGGDLFLGTSLTDAYEIYFGLRMPVAGSGSLSLNPQGVQNAASYAPTGNPIAPGELVYLYVSGLTVTPQTATPPYPSSLGGVTVLINGNPAPLYSVSGTQLVALVPFATAGPTATIVVQAKGATSNTVTVPVAPTAPGVFSQLENGSGLGAIRHAADYSVVTADNPAHSGEVVLIYLTGLGAVNPPVKDGDGGSADPLSVTTATPTVLVGSTPTTVLYSGMSAYPGLYQLNVQLPAIAGGTTTLPVVITTPNAVHDQVDIAVAP